MNNIFGSVQYLFKTNYEKKCNSYKKNIHVGPSSSIYISNIFGSATTEKQNSKNYIIHTPKTYILVFSLVYISVIFVVA